MCLHFIVVSRNNGMCSDDDFIYLFAWLFLCWPWLKESWGNFRNGGMITLQCWANIATVFYFLSDM